MPNSVSTLRSVTCRVSCNPSVTPSICLQLMSLLSNSSLFLHKITCCIFHYFTYWTYFIGQFNVRNIFLILCFQHPHCDLFRALLFFSSFICELKCYKDQHKRFRVKSFGSRAERNWTMHSEKYIKTGDSATSCYGCDAIINTEITQCRLIYCLSGLPAQKCKPPLSGDQDGGPQYKLNPMYCSSLKGEWCIHVFFFLSGRHLFKVCNIIFVSVSTVF